MALTLIANIGSRETAEQLAGQVQNILVATVTKTLVKKKAALCLLHLFRRNPDCLVMSDAQQKLISLLEFPSFGFLTALMGLLLGIAETHREGFEPAVPKCIDLLHRIVGNRDIAKEYLYHNVPNPWVQVKLLRFLTLYPIPEDKTVRATLSETLQKILATADSKGTEVNYRNALNAILFGAIDLAIVGNFDDTLLQQCAVLLGRFIAAKETNIRYLGLHHMAKLAAILTSEAAGAIRKHQETVLLSLKDADISIRRRALDLIYSMCDRSNAQGIVGELLAYTQNAEYDIREELAIKIAILAEKFAADYRWYVDTILHLIAIAGDFVSDDVWHRVCRIVTNHEDVQEYAARRAFQAASDPRCHEIAARTAGYILGEFGHLIADEDGSRPMDQFRVLHRKFITYTPRSKALLLSTYIKFVNLYPEEAELLRLVADVLKHHASYIDAEIQQRAVEYLALARTPQLLGTVWDVMPPYTEKADAPEPAAPAEAQPASPVAARNAPQYSSPVAAAPPMAAAPVAAAQPAAPPVPQGPVPQLSARNKEFFVRLTMVAEGVLYEDEVLQIGVRSTYQQSFGRVMLYFGNAAQVPLTNLQLSVVPSPAVAAQVQGEVKELGPGVQLPMAVIVTCAEEFKDPPVCQLSFVVAGAPITITLYMPVVLTKFVEPLQLSRDDFFHRWKQIQGAPLEHVAIVKFSNQKNSDMAFLGKLISTGFRLAVLAGVDPNVNNLVAAGTFCSTSKQVVCLLRIETNPGVGMARVTIRTFHGPVTEALRLLVIPQLGEVVPQ